MYLENAERCGRIPIADRTGCQGRQEVHAAGIRKVCEEV